MDLPANWQSPITAAPGQIQINLGPLSLLPSRMDLSQFRLDLQKALLKAGTERSTPIQLTTEGVIWDGHHAVRIAAEQGTTISVLVVNEKVNPSAASILDLPVR
jgi:hypothetical protein